MLAIIGIIIVLGSVIGGYLLEKGNISVLYQPAEFVIIGGAFVGALIVTCTPSVLHEILGSFKTIFNSNKSSKEDFTDLLVLLYDIFTKIRKEDLLSLEPDIEAPETSAFFQKYPIVKKKPLVLKFICDNLRAYMLLGQGSDPMLLEELMDIEIDAFSQEAHVVSSTIIKAGDSLPGFGIVAAVMGVVITMGKMGESPEVIGHSVGAALVGTFLGILLCYGFIAPMGANLEHKKKEELKFIEVTKASILAFVKDISPMIAVEFGRRVIFNHEKPSFQELSDKIRKAA